MTTTKLNISFTGAGLTHLQLQLLLCIAEIETYYDPFHRNHSRSNKSSLSKTGIAEHFVKTRPAKKKFIADQVPILENAGFLGNRDVQHANQSGTVKSGSFLISSGFQLTEKGQATANELKEVLTSTAKLLMPVENTPAPQSM